MSIPLALLVAGCTYPVDVSAPGAEQAVESVVSGQSHVKIFDVACPAGVTAVVGATFTCHFIGPHDATYDARLQITKVRGQVVSFSINTAPAARPHHGRRGEKRTPSPRAARRSTSAAIAKSAVTSRLRVTVPS